MQKLTNKEEEIMHILWKLEKAFVKDVLAIRMSVAPGADNTEKFTWATKDGAHTSKFKFKTEDVD